MKDRSVLNGVLRKETGEVLPPPSRDRWTRVRVAKEFHGQSRTLVDHGLMTDINEIIGRFKKTGVFPTVVKEPQFVDCTPFNKTLTELANEALDTKAKYKAFENERSEKAKTEKAAKDAEVAADAAAGKAARLAKGAAKAPEASSEGS